MTAAELSAEESAEVQRFGMDRYDPVEDVEANDRAASAMERFGAAITEACEALVEAVAEFVRPITEWMASIPDSTWAMLATDRRVKSLIDSRCEEALARIDAMAGVS